MFRNTKNDSGREQYTIPSMSGLTTRYSNTDLYLQRTAIIKKDETGFGLSISGDQPCYVASVKQGGAAEKAGVQQGDKIIKVNGKVVTNSKHKDVIKLIRSGSHVALTLFGPFKAPLGSVLNSSVKRVTNPESKDAEKEKEVLQQKVNTIRVMYETVYEEHDKLRKACKANPSDRNLIKRLQEKDKTLKILEAQLQSLPGGTGNFSGDSQKIWKLRKANPSDSKLQDKLQEKEETLKSLEAQLPGGTGNFSQDSQFALWPRIIRCLEVVEKRGLHIKGIYRISCIRNKMESLYQMLDHDPESVDLNLEHVNTICSVVKHYLRQCPEPLLTFKLYQSFIQIAQDNMKGDRNKENTVKRLRDLTDKLPILNRKACEILICHLKRVASHADENDMNSFHLGVIFGPLLLRPQNSQGLSALLDLQNQSLVVTFLIDSTERLFGNIMDCEVESGENTDEIYPQQMKNIAGKNSMGILPKEILNMDKDSIDLYKKALQDGKVSVYNIRLMVVGHYDVGKTTLTKRLLGEHVNITERASTDGIDVHVDRCKISLKDGAWILQKSDKARKTIFHQLAKLFRKDDQEVTQLKSSEEMNAMSDIRDTLHESAKPQEQTGSQTGSSLDVDKAQKQKTTAEYTEDRAKTEKKHSRIQTVIKESAEIRDFHSQSTNDIEKSAVDSVDEEYAQNLRHLKKFVENVEVDKEHLETSDLSLWDFAGQNVFYATHQVFFSRRAVYLLVTNISKHIDDTVDDDPCHTDCRGEAKYRIAEYIDFWLNSIHEFCSNEGESGPPIILVGTFADQLKEDISPDDAWSSLREFLVDKAASCHLTTENFLIDNSVEDENIQSLKKHIFNEASKQAYWGEDIPAKGVTLEDVLIGIKEENLKVLHKDRLKELNKTLPAPIETDEELELYLQFHHEMGNILYFSKDDLTNYILLDPQWLIDAFKSVITAKLFCISRTNIQKEWMEFERTAMLKPVLIDAVWEKLENSGYKNYRDLLLTYMEILGLVARPVQQEDHSAEVEDWYFVPCMLKEPPPEKETCYCDSPDCKYTSKLCYTTAEEPGRRFLPATMFNKLLAACLRKWPLSKQNGKSMIFCGGAIFKLKANHFLYIFFYEHVIQIWITRCSSDGQFPNISLCTETKENIEDILKTNIRMHSKIIAFVKCPRAVLYSNENMQPLEPTENNSTEEIVCYCQNNKHVVQYGDLTKFWSCVQDSNHSSEFESDQTSLTEKDFSKIASRIGKEYLQLGRKLGLGEAKLDHIQLDKLTTQDRIVAMLCEWKKQMADKASACELRRALAAIGKDASAVLR